MGGQIVNLDGKREWTNIQSLTLSTQESWQSCPFTLHFNNLLSEVSYLVKQANSLFLKYNFYTSAFCLWCHVPCFCLLPGQPPGLAWTCLLPGQPSWPTSWHSLNPTSLETSSSICPNIFLYNQCLSFDTLKILAYIFTYLFMFKFCGLSAIRDQKSSSVKSQIVNIWVPRVII